MGASQSQCINARNELDKLDKKKQDLQKQIHERWKENQESEKIQESETDVSKDSNKIENIKDSKKGEEDSNGSLTGGKKRKRTKKDGKKHMKKTGKKHMKKTGKKHMKKTGKK